MIQSQSVNLETIMVKLNLIYGKTTQICLVLEDRDDPGKNQIDLNLLIVILVIREEVTVEKVEKRGIITIVICILLKDKLFQN